MLKTNKQLTFRMRTDAKHTPPEISNKFSALTAKSLVIFLVTAFVLASCSSDITDSASKNSVTNTQTSSHYVIKGLFEEKKDACIIDGKQFKDGKLTTIDSKQVSINTEGSMEIADKLPKGDYYYITCTGNYLDETTQQTSTQPVTLKGFFSEANGVHNINVFTDMIAEHVQDELTKKLSSSSVPSPNPNEASIFKQINETASKAIVKVMRIKDEEANEINDVSLLDSAHPSSAGDVALLIANINILKNHDFSGNDLAIKPQFDATTGEVKADSIENIADPLTAKANLKLVDDAIKATDDKVKREDFENIGDFSKLDDTDAGNTDNTQKQKPAVTPPTVTPDGQNPQTHTTGTPKVEQPKKPEPSGTITLSSKSTLNGKHFREVGTARTVYMAPIKTPIKVVIDSSDLHITGDVQYIVVTSFINSDGKSVSNKIHATAKGFSLPETDLNQLNMDFIFCAVKDFNKATDCLDKANPAIAKAYFSISIIHSKTTTATVHLNDMAFLLVNSEGQAEVGIGFNSTIPKMQNSDKEITLPAGIDDAYRLSLYMPGNIIQNPVADKTYYIAYGDNVHSQPHEITTGNFDSIGAFSDFVNPASVHALGDEGLVVGFCEIDTANKDHKPKSVYGFPCGDGGTVVKTFVLKTTAITP